MELEIDGSGAVLRGKADEMHAVGSFRNGKGRGDGSPSGGNRARFQHLGTFGGKAGA